MKRNRDDKSGIVIDKHNPGLKGRILEKVKGGYLVRWFNDGFVGMLPSRRLHVVKPEQKKQREELLSYQHFV